MTVLRFTLSCTPTAQARVRHTVRCGHSVAYKSAGQKNAEAVLDDLLSARAPKKPLEGPLVLEFVAGMPIPASTPKKQREAMLRGEIAHTKKPDLDNMAKTPCRAPGSGATTGRWCPCVARNATPPSRIGR